MQHTQHTFRAALFSFALVAAALSAPVAFAQSHDHGAHDHGAAMTPAASDAAQVEWIAGEVRRIEPAQARLTIKHADIRHLDMPGMTMVFKLKPGVLSAERLAQLKVGERIEFQAEREKGQLTLTALRAPQPAKVD
jgi:Cu(I)/Ag(I) efflux system periplasmic protein CusF